MRRKIEMIEMTDDNFPYLASRIKKFFHHRDIVYWHNFDCGSKHHIQGDFSMRNCDSKEIIRVRPIHLHYNVKCQIVTPKSDPVCNDHFLRIRFGEGYGGLIMLGDCIGFGGNRLHVKTRSVVPPYRYQYDVFQIWDPNGGFGHIHVTPPDLGEFTDYDLI